MTKILITSMLFYTSIAMAWDERGHNTVGYVAALATEHALTAEEKKLLAGFFSERTYSLGHLNNIPDISWKFARPHEIMKLNSPTHYLDAEGLLGLPEKDYDEAYAERIRNLEKDYKKLQAQFEGKPNPLPAGGDKINIYSNVGTAPWRTQEMFNLVVESLQCASKSKFKHKNPKTFVNPFKAGPKGIALPYKCNPRSTRLENVYAALVFAGIMGHYIADLGQPYHCTADFDGWTSGQGGIHHFFESSITHDLPQDFLNTVTKGAAENFEKIWKELGADPKDPYFATQVALNLAANSIKIYPKLKKLDRELALKKEGEKLPWGSRPGKIFAERISPKDPKIVKAFAPIITDRITTSSVLLSRLWVEAWRKAGKPDLSDVDLIRIAYPLDVPFLKPWYAPSASL